MTEPTIEEIQKTSEYPDRRIKGIMYTMASSGIGLGVWDYMCWKRIQPAAATTPGIEYTDVRIHRLPKLKKLSGVDNYLNHLNDNNYSREPSGHFQNYSLRSSRLCRSYDHR